MITAIVIFFIIGILGIIAYTKDKYDLEICNSIFFFLLAIVFIYLKVKIN